jgi:hypothetical protein
MITAKNKTFHPQKSNLDHYIANIDSITFLFRNKKGCSDILKVINNTLKL